MPVAIFRRCVDSGAHCQRSLAPISGDQDSKIDEVCEFFYSGLDPAMMKGEAADTLDADFGRRRRFPAMLKINGPMKYSFRSRRSPRGNILFFNNALFSLPNQPYSRGRTAENDTEESHFGSFVRSDL